MYRQALIGEVPRAEVIAVVGAVARLGLREELERRATLGLRFADREMDVEAILRPLTLNVIGVGNGLLPRQRILRRRRFHRAHIAGHAALGALGRNLERGAGEDRAARIKRRAGEEVAVSPFGNLDGV